MLRCFITFFVSLFLLMACSESTPSLVVNKVAGNTMGTTYHISWVAEKDGNKSNDPESLKEAVDLRLKQINAIMSTYDTSSELSLINQSSESNQNVEITAELADVLSVSRYVYEHSDGLFDVTVGPLVNAWGFGPTPDIHNELNDEAIADLLGKIGSQHWRISVAGEKSRLRKDQPLYIDLSAVAKGWAVDEIARLLEQRGISSFLAEIGGELKTKGVKPDGSQWKIAIERPVANPLEAQQVQLILSPGDKGVATSGDYRNYYEVKGERYSHTINPFTGKPIKHELASVTVVHNDCAYADAWATALNVAGPKAGMALAEKNQLAVYMIVRNNNGFDELASSQFVEQFGNPGSK